MNDPRLTLQMDLIPGVRIGPFIFGRPLPKDVQELVVLETTENVGGLAWEEYVLTLPLQGTYSIYVEGGVVEHVDCREKCFVGTENIVGKACEDIERILGCKVHFEGSESLSDELQSVYSIDSLGLQLWVSQSRVVTVQCAVAGA